jgi:hypothetical protein
MLACDLAQAVHFEKQYYDIMDGQLDDYDAALVQIQRKKEILQGVSGPDATMKANIDAEVRLSNIFVAALHCWSHNSEHVWMMPALFW